MLMKDISTSLNCHDILGHLGKAFLVFLDGWTVWLVNVVGSFDGWAELPIFISAIPRVTSMTSSLVEVSVAPSRAFLQ